MMKNITLSFKLKLALSIFISFCFLNIVKAQVSSIFYCSEGDSLSSWEFIGPEDHHHNNAPYTGIVTAIAVDPENDSILYAGSNTSGLYKSIDFGLNWQSLTDQLKISGLGIIDVVLDRTNHSRILALTGCRSNGYGGYSLGLIVSNNGGETWQLENSFNTNAQFYSEADYQFGVIKQHPLDSNVWFIGGLKKLYRSLDNGISWSTCLSYTSIEDPLVQSENWSDSNAGAMLFRDIEFDLRSDSVVFCSTINSKPLSGFAPVHIWRTSNLGLSWENVSPSDSIRSVARLDVCDLVDSSLYCMTMVGSQESYIYKWNEPSATWAFIDSVHLGGGTNWHYYKNEFEALTIDTFIVAGISFRIFVVDTSDTFESNNFGLHDDVRDIHILKNGSTTRMFLGTDGGVQFSSFSSSLDLIEEDITWQELNGVGLKLTQIYGHADFERSEKVLFGAQDLGTYLGSNNIFSYRFGGDGGYVSSNEYFEGFAIFGSQSIRNYTNNFGSNSTNIPGEDSYSTPYGNSAETLKNKHFFKSKDQRKMLIGGIGLAEWSMNELDSTFVEELATLLPFEIPISPFQNTSDFAKISSYGSSAADGNLSYVAFKGSYWVEGANIEFESGVNNHLINSEGELINKFFKSTNGGESYQDITDEFYYLEGEQKKYPYSFGVVSSIVCDYRDTNIVYAGIDNYLGNAHVLKSIDGGNHWVNLSEGLPVLPLRELLMQDGANGRLFAATDAGVYYLANQYSTEWVCFNSNLPPCIVTHMEIDYCSNTMTISTYGKGIWVVDLPEVNENQIFSEDYTIDSFEVHTYPNDVIVESGAILTVKGHLFMKENNKLTVLPGGKLVLDGGLISNSCNGFWQGVEVVGNSTEPQSSSVNQGVVEIRNEGTISNAQIGIALKQLDYECQLIDGTTGGMVFSDNGIFRNNYVDVEFGPYLNILSNGNASNNRSQFVKTKFVTDQPLINDLKNKWHVRLDGVHNVLFEGCEFVNQRDLDSIVDQEGIGISSWNSSFIVSDYCPTQSQSYVDTPCNELELIHNTFENLNFGIRQESVLSTATFLVDNARFNGNNYGIHAKSTMGLSVIRCVFEINPQGFLFIEDYTYPYGIHLDRCSGYEVEQNSFFGEGTDTLRTGLAISSSSGFSWDLGLPYVEEPNRVYYNNFMDLYAATIIQGDNNIYMNETEGLQVMCGLYDGNGYDIALTGNASMAAKQGSSDNPLTDEDETQPAGNRFLTNLSGCADNNAIHIEANNPLYFYFCTPNEFAFPSDVCSSTPGKLLKYQLAFPSISREEECDDGTSFLEDPGVHLQVTLDKISLVDYLNNEIEEIEDNGQTESVIELINDQFLSSYALRSELLSYCPNLSDKVLYSLIEREPALNQWHLCEILIQCSPLSPFVLSKYQLESPLIGYYHSLLMNYQDEEATELAGIKDVARWNKAEKEKAKYDYYRTRFFDKNTTVSNWTDIKNLASAENKWMDLRMKTSIAIMQNDFIQADSLFTLMNDSSESNKWIDVARVFSDLKRNGIAIRNISTEKRLMLETIAEQDCIGNYEAQILLSKISDDYYLQDYVSMPSKLRNYEINEDKEYQELFEEELAIFPNPAAEQTLISGKLLDGIETAYFHISDSNGKLKEVIDATQCRGVTSIDLNQYSSGEYFCCLIINGRPSTTSKFVVLR